MLRENGDPDGETVHNPGLGRWPRSLFGLKMYRNVCADNFMWSTDYPHRAATWLHSQEVLAREFSEMPEADKRKLVRENAAKLNGFIPQ